MWCWHHPIIIIIINHPALRQGYSLLYIHPHIHYDRDTPYYTYIHIYIMTRILPSVYTTTDTLWPRYSYFTYTHILYYLVYDTYIHTYIMTRIFPTIHTSTHTLWQGYSVLYIHPHIHYDKDTSYYTYIHTYIITRILPSIHTSTHTLSQGYFLLYMHSYIMTRILPPNSETSMSSTYVARSKVRVWLTRLVASMDKNTLLRLGGNE